MWADNCPGFKERIFCQGVNRRWELSSPGGQREQPWWELLCSESASRLCGLRAQMSRNSKIKVVGAVLTPLVSMCCKGLDVVIQHFHPPLFPYTMPYGRWAANTANFAVQLPRLWCAFAEEDLCCVMRREGQLVFGFQVYGTFTGLETPELRGMWQLRR